MYSDKQNKKCLYFKKWLNGKVIIHCNYNNEIKFECSYELGILFLVIIEIRCFGLFACCVRSGEYK